MIRPLLAVACLALAACTPKPGTSPEGPAPAADPPAGPVSGADSDSPWDRAKARGISFRGIGTEPGWLVEVGAGDAPPLHLELDYGERRLHVPQAERTGDGYRGMAGDTAVSLSIVRERCNDGMSDNEYPASITLAVGGDTFRGCGRFLTE